jgi:hypothetical protein
MISGNPARRVDNSLNNVVARRINEFLFFDDWQEARKYLSSSGSIVHLIIFLMRSTGPWHRIS